MPFPTILPVITALPFVDAVMAPLSRWAPFVATYLWAITSLRQSKRAESADRNTPADG